MNKAMKENYRIDTSKGMEIGLYTLADHVADPKTGKRLTNQERINEIVEAAKFADQAGLDVFGVGESHQEYFTGQANQVILGAIAAQTKNIKLTSAVSVLSTNDPVRVYEEYATLDLLSDGRAEIAAGRGSRTGVYDLMGYSVNDYEELFEVKMHLLKLLNEAKPGEKINWSGKFRADLRDAEIIPQPKGGHLPVWRAVGGPDESAIKAGLDGIPMMLTTLSGPSKYFYPGVKGWRLGLEKSGYDPADYPLTIASLMGLGKDTKTAMDKMYPYLNAGWSAVRGEDFPRIVFDHSVGKEQSLMIGSPEEIIDKILFQYEMYHHQRFVAEIDFGGVPLDQVKENIELLATKVMPTVKKYTKE